ncbi:MAG TPA: hypothetical protein DEB06_01700 [Phycisphaerales bacterium]|nr:hypothetical protein [Phycisphaerales bacterium]
MIEGRLRVVASSWSDNPMKGAEVYRWMDERLDPARFEFTFVGRCGAPLARARVVPPLASAELADLLRGQHVYVTASREDSCSNALIEALACGLPALYHDSGGNRELTGFGGLPFSRPEEIPHRLERLRAHHGAFRALIRVPTIDEVCDAYLALALGDEAYR